MCLQAVAAGWGHTFTFREALWRLRDRRDRDPLPTRPACVRGPTQCARRVGGPKLSTRPRRFARNRGTAPAQHFDLYANLRPLKAYPGWRITPLRADLLRRDILFVAS
jgi:hypothetical protein